MLPFVPHRMNAPICSSQDEAARQAEVEARRAAMSAVHELAQRARASAHEGV